MMNDDPIRIIQGNCLEVMDRLAADGVQVDAVVTDPPYELGFMGKAWDKSGIAFQAETWERCFRLLKPGGHLLAFGGTRTIHRITCAVEDAGFDIRDMVSWVYGQGFPKSLNVGKAIDKELGAERKSIINPRWISKYPNGPGGGGGAHISQLNSNILCNQLRTTLPSSPEAKQWDGWGTALKPACEPACMARKPLSESSVARNVLKHGTGGINADGCRVDPTGERLGGGGENRATFAGKEGWGRPWMKDEVKTDAHTEIVRSNVDYATKAGRWPANLIHDGSPEVLEVFGEPARFFYCAKAGKKDRNGSKHPTVKPLALMRYLVRLVTPPGGIVLDPFAGTGTTGEAAMLEGMRGILIEREDEYIQDIRRRLGCIDESSEPEAVKKQKSLTLLWDEAVA